MEWFWKELGIFLPVMLVKISVVACVQECIKIINPLSRGFFFGGVGITHPSFQSIVDMRKFLQVDSAWQTILMSFCNWILGHRIMV
jgi:hypothetical protein